MPKRTYLVKEIDKRLRRAAELNIPTAIGGGTVLATPQHALDGPEHTEAADTGAKLATAAHSGLLLPLSGDAEDRLAGDGTWVADAADTFLTKTRGAGETAFSHGNMGAAETIDLADGNVHIGTLDANCALTFTGYSTGGDGISFALFVTQDGTGGRTVAFPAEVVNGAALAAALDTTASMLQIVSFVSPDGGTSVYGFIAGAGVTDHGALSGLADDGHPQYLTDAEHEAVDHTGLPGVGAGAGQHILLADGHATPFTFNDLLQMDDGSDFMWSDP